MKELLKPLIIVCSILILLQQSAAQAVDRPLRDRGNLRQSKLEPFTQNERTTMKSQVVTANRFTGPEGATSSFAPRGEAIRPEHLALNVPDPVAAVKWYTENLGMKVMRQGGPPANTTFVADSGGHMMLEIAHNADYPLLEPAKLSHMSIHLAFMVSDIAALKKELVRAGATMVEDIRKIPSGDQVLMLRDPWGLPIQFVERVKPMLKFTGVRPEHLALNVSDSRATAKWLVTNLGMKIMREGGAPTYGMFVADSSDQMMFELSQDTLYPVIDFHKVSHMSIHFASMVSDVAAVKERLLKAGATVADDITKTASGDRVVTLRDPQGFPLQFVERVAPMLK